MGLCGLTSGVYIEWLLETCKKVVENEMAREEKQLKQQIEQEAERRGYKKGIELEQLRNAEFFEEDYQNKERLEELESELKLLEEENEE